jgi:predicted nucleic acid-binding protein
MCVIIDMNTLPCIFNPENKDHNEFKSMLDWIDKGKGRIVYGGSGYLSELEKMTRYRRILNDYGRKRKTIKLDDDKVDQEQQKVKNKLEKIDQISDFNDTHIVAIAIVSGCRLVCSKNSEHYPFIKDKRLYPSKFRKVSIYRGYADKEMLLSRSVKRLCKRCREEK